MCAPSTRGRTACWPTAAERALLIDCSTIDVETARAVAAAAEARGHAMLDAPVSGGVGGAEAGTLTFMVGGSDAGLRSRGADPRGDGQDDRPRRRRRQRPGGQDLQQHDARHPDDLGVPRPWCWPRSSASSTKSCSTSAPRRPASAGRLTTYCPVPGPVPTSPANRDYRPGFTAAMMLKDLRLAQGAAQTVGAATPLGAEATQLYTLFAQKRMRG